MARETSIVFKGIDQLTGPLNTMRGSSKAFSKDLEETARQAQNYRKRQEELVKQMAATRTGLTEAADKLKQAKKAHAELNTEASRTDLEKAYEQYDRAKEELREYEAAAKDTRRALVNLNDQQRRQQEDAGGGSGGLLNALGQSGLIKMAGDTASQLANFAVGSAFGDEVGSLFWGALSGAASGAALGSIIPGIGTVAGAAVGGAIGLVQSGIQVAQARDDAFKSYYNAVYDQQAGEIDENMSTGSTLAGSRENDLRVFETMLGDHSAAQQFQHALIELGRTPPFSYDTVSALSKDMLGLGLNTEDALSRINALAEAGAALNLSQSNVSSIVSYLESAQLAGTIDSRIVKSLSKMGINVYEALARAFSIAPEDVADHLSELDADAAIQAIYDYMASNFAGASKGLTEAYTGSAGIIDSYREDWESAGGTSYNSLRQVSMKRDIEVYGGTLGEEMEEAYSMIGAGRAALENLKDAYTRDANNAVLLGSGLEQDWSEDVVNIISGLRDDYVEAKTAYEKGDASAGARIEGIMESVAGLAQQQFEASDLYKQNLDAEAEALDALRDNTAAMVAATAAYERQLAATRGGLKGAAEAVFLNSIHGENTAGTGVVEEHRSEIEAARRAQQGGKSNAFGLNRVPYDDYPALLHEGERVLTAAQARRMGNNGGYFQPSVPAAPGFAYGLNQVPYDDFPARLHEGERVLTAVQARRMDRAGSGVSVQVTVDSLVVREEADLEKIAYYLMEEAKFRRMAGEYEPLN